MAFFSLTVLRRLFFNRDSISFDYEKSGQHKTSDLDPVYTGLDKCLNGQKLARIHLSFMREPWNRASSWTANNGTEFARFRVSGLQKNKKCVRSNFIPTRVNGVLVRKKHSQFWGLQRFLKDFNKPETTSKKGTVQRTFTASLFFLTQNRRNEGIGVRRGYARNSCTALTLAWGCAFTPIAMGSLRHLG